MGGDEASALCTAACDSLGSMGGLLFAVLAFAWGQWQRRRARGALGELEQLKQSLRPVPVQRVELLHLSVPPGGELPAPPRTPRELVDVPGPFTAPRSSSSPPDGS